MRTVVAESDDPIIKTMMLEPMPSKDSGFFKNAFERKKWETIKKWYDNKETSEDSGIEDWRAIKRDKETLEGIARREIGEREGVAELDEEETPEGSNIEEWTVIWREIDEDAASVFSAKDAVLISPPISEP